jgi:cytochrome c-type biogenesis protein CcmE
MTRKRRRLLAVLAGLAALGVASALVLSAFRDNLVFFYGPSELQAKHVPEGRRLRIGGLVETGSVGHDDQGRTLTFRVTDGRSDVRVTYSGVVPDLFREGQGVVAEGALASDGSFRATSVLAKHDERYMPPEVAAALKQAGRWQESGQAATAEVKP